MLQTGTITESLLSGINSSLYSHYTGILPYTNPDTNTTTPRDLFSSRYYYVLNNSLPLSGSIRIDFALTETMTEPSINGSTPLRRSSALTDPRPNQSFLNHANLYSSANSSLNTDVATINSTEPTLYTYVCMYIIATGVDNNYSTINSKPTFIGVFLLPDPLI
jgi:hypothetical protein